MRRGCDELYQSVKADASICSAMRNECFFKYIKIDYNSFNEKMKTIVYENLTGT